MNIFDFNLEYPLSDVIISITLFVLSFVAFFYFGYFRDMRKGEDQENYKFKDMLIEGYIHKFDEYNHIISELQTKIDMIELKINPEKGASLQNEIIASSDVVDDMSQKKKNISHTESPVTKCVIITDNEDDIKQDAGLRLNTVGSILKMLDVPLTSREIQTRIRKSREHTSRLLKKLYSQNIVMRDESTRPFKYKITNEGRKLLEQTTA
jgi:predicted transcriptional regulator